jgi:hypothetical protein
LGLPDLASSATWERVENLSTKLALLQRSCAVLNTSAGLVQCFGKGGAVLELPAVRQLMEMTSNDCLLCKINHWNGES